MVRTRLAFGVGILALFLVASTFGALPAGRSSGPRVEDGPATSTAVGGSTPGSVALARLPPPWLDAAGPSPAMADPSGVYYLQEGVDFMSENGSATDEFTVLSETFPVVSSPYGVRDTSATGYELNGVTSAGDWIQMVVGDNWPVGSAQCNVPTFDLFYEIWNNSGTSVAGPAWVQSASCTQAFNPAPGDVLGLSMSLNCPTGGTGSVCMTFSDFTQGLSTTAIQTQPEYAAHGTVASHFQNWPNLSSVTNGYFVGPATEVVDQANACPSFTMPPVYYTMNSSNDLAITEFNAWSDEWVPSADFLCSGLTNTEGALTDSPATSFVQAAEKTSLGVHWLGAQNWSAASAQIVGTPAPGQTRFETDPVPWAFSVEVDGSNTTPVVVDAGPAYGVDGVVTGGSPSGVVCNWTLNGVPYSPGPPTCTWSLPATASGTTVIAGLAVDSALNAEARSATLVVEPDPSVTLGASPATVDQDHMVTFTATAAGGIPPYRYAWSGLPRPCSGTATSTSVSCTPTVPGTYTVAVLVTDSFGFNGTSGPLAFEVDPLCSGESCYPVTFQVAASPPEEWGAGLFVDCVPCGTSVAVATSNTTGLTVEFAVPNGTYAFLLVGGPDERVVEPGPVGNLTVNGSAIDQTVELAKGSTSTVAFSETGLVKGTSWCVTLGWLRCTTAGAFSVADLTAGTYPFAIQPIAGYTQSTEIAGVPAPSSGWVAVAGHPTHVRTQFTQQTYLLTFTETGLAKGKGWSVKVAGPFHGRTRAESRSSKGETIVFEVPNGTFNYTVRSVAGYNGSGPGVVLVSGLPVNVTVVFERLAPAGARDAGSPASVLSPAASPRTTAAAPAGATAVVLALLRRLL